MEEVILSKEGLEQLKEELEYLKLTKRPEIIERIKFARGLGDLSENAEYDAAKNEQAQIEGKILEIEDKLKRATIIDESNRQEGVVTIGSIVTVFDQDVNEEVVYQITGTTEADIDSEPMKISNESPVGRALLGKKVGEDVVVLVQNNFSYALTIKDIK